MKHTTQARPQAPSKVAREGDSIAQLLAHQPPDPGFNSQPPEFFSQEKRVDVTEVNQRRCLEESGQSLENVDGTHLVLASGKLLKLVLQKKLPQSISFQKDLKSNFVSLVQICWSPSFQGRSRCKSSMVVKPNLQFFRTLCTSPGRLARRSLDRSARGRRTCPWASLGGVSCPKTEKKSYINLTLLK